MKTIQDESFGVVPLFRVGEEWRVLLIHQISHRGGRNTFWIFPKGHAEVGESPTEAALRELEEETGISDVTLDTTWSFSVSYNFIHEGAKIEKQAHFFIGFCNKSETAISQPHEVLELKWCTFKEAEQLLSHQNSRDILAKVQVALQSIS
jgi:8-oxo-dGTP pyrophosphatase MutT (NUDIX family)